MTSIEVGGGGWSAQLPGGWRATDPARPGYVEAPDGTAGAYFLHVVIRGDDLVASMQHARSTERDRLPDDVDGWRAVRQCDASDGPDVDLSTDYYNATALYLICSRMLGRGRRFVRMTFHDYDCADPARSSHQPHRWLASLTLHEDAG